MCEIHASPPWSSSCTSWRSPYHWSQRFYPSRSPKSDGRSFCRTCKPFGYLQIFYRMWTVFFCRIWNHSAKKLPSASNIGANGFPNVRARNYSTIEAKLLVVTLKSPHKPRHFNASFRWPNSASHSNHCWRVSFSFSHIVHRNYCLSLILYIPY